MAPAFATEPSLQQELTKAAANYAEMFNTKDAAGVAALFAKDAVFVNSSAQGRGTAEITQEVERLYKIGFTRVEFTVNQVWPIAEGVATATGDFKYTGKKANGDPLEFNGTWTSVDVKENGQWKIQMSTGFGKNAPATAQIK
jgi:uncharacterized protein (TIGR02246 family)